MNEFDRHKQVQDEINKITYQQGLVLGLQIGAGVLTLIMILISAGLKFELILCQ